MSFIQINTIHCPKRDHPTGLTLTVALNYTLVTDIIRLLAKAGKQAYRLASVGFVSMFRLRLKKEIQFKKEIEDYIAYKRKISIGASIVQQNFLINFMKQYKIESIKDIHFPLIEAYSRDIFETTSSYYSLLTAMKSMRGLLRYYHHLDWRLIKDTGPVLTVEPEETILPLDMKDLRDARNREMVGKRKKDPIKWSYRNLAKHYGMTVRASWEIINRYKDIY